MGIKDWFGGDKKKNEFREKVKDAVSDGKLTPQKIAELEAARQALDVDDASNDKTRFRREAYNEAVSAVKAGGKLTSDEARELARIQKFLALSDDQIEKTRWDLVRLKTFTDIREGRLPVVSPTHNALRKLKLEDGEVPHYCVPAEIYLVADVGTAVGSKFASGGTYTLGAGASHELPMKDAMKQDAGVFLLTSKRFLLRAEGHDHAFDIRAVEPYYFYRDAIRFKGRKGPTALKFQSEGVVDVVGALIERFLRQPG